MKVSSIGFLSFLVTAASAAREKYRYIGSGLSASASYYGDDAQCGAWPFGDYADVQASESMYEAVSNGNASSTTSPQMYTYFNIWTNCKAKSATLLTTENIDGTIGKPKIKFSNLRSASAKGKLEASIVRCTLTEEDMCPEPLPDDNTNSDPDDGDDGCYTYTYYTCDYEKAKTETIFVSATWVGEGKAYLSKSKSVNRYEGGYSRSKSEGLSRSANTKLMIKTPNKVFLRSNNVDGSIGNNTYLDISVWTY